MFTKTKTDLVEAVALETSMSKAKAKQAVDALLDSITDGLSSGDGKVTLTGFGSFQVKEQKERAGRSPQTGEKIKIPAKKVVKFNPGKTLQKVVAP